MSAQIGNVLKNHELRIRGLEEKVKDYKPSDIVMKKELSGLPRLGTYLHKSF